jgi:putative holliday junction resolvase
MARIMALDYGGARIGVAMTDPLEIIASGYTTLQNDAESFSNIYAICVEKEVESIVVGIPFNEESEIGASAKKALLFAESLSKLFKEKSLPVKMYGQDERYTTREAHDIMRMNKVKTKNKKKVVDQIAAVRILEDFMRSGNKKELDFSAYQLH